MPTPQALSSSPSTADNDAIPWTAQLQMLQKQAWAGLVQSLPLAMGCGLVGLIVGVASKPFLGLALGAGSFAIICSWQFPRSALWFFLIYMPFSGTVTYWLAGGNSLFQLAKDAFYIPALISLYLAVKQSSKEKFLKPSAILPGLWILLFFSILSLLFVSIPRQFSEGGLLLFQGLLGMKVFIGYIPLIFLMQFLIRSQRELWFFNRLHVVLAIVCSWLCLIQYLFLLTGRCAGTDHLTGSALFTASIQAKCFVGGSLLYSPSQGVIRLPGTFVAPWQWGWFLIANSYFVFAGAFADPAWQWRIIGFLGMGSVTMAAVICGQRIALVLVPVCFLLLMILTGQFVNWKRFIPIAILSVIAGFIAWELFPNLILDRIQSFQDRWAASPADAMIADQVDFVWKSMKGSALILGHGLGSATNSARMFGETRLIETWFPKVLFEVGVLGLAIFIIFVTILSIATFITYRRLKNRSFKDLAACYWVFILFISYQTYYYPLDVDPVAVYYWAMVGVIFRLADIDRHGLIATEQSEGEGQIPESLPQKRQRFNVLSGSRSVAPQSQKNQRFAPLRNPQPK